MAAISAETQIVFQEVMVRVGEYAVQWVHLDEGLRGGTYRPEDPNDVRCLRFICWQQRYEGVSELERLDRGSFLTELPVTTAVDSLLVVCRRLIEILQECKQTGESYTDRLQLMSHLSPANFVLHPPFFSWPAEAIR